MLKLQANNMKYWYIPMTLAYLGIAVGLWLITMIFQGEISITSTAEHLHAESIPANPTQAKIISAARAYISTKPRYKSAYYQGGYPTDNKGVCTDLVAAALLGADFSLKDALDTDLVAHPENYEVDDPDPNIDYRRVKNVLAYLKHNQLELPTDLSNEKNLATFLPGDILVFQEHVALVSDKRSASGLPYVLHHASPFQLQFEEDLLSTRKDLIGHFRLKQAN